MALPSRDASRRPDAFVNCPNCGRDVADDPFCGGCGQRIHRGRFELIPLARDAVDEALNLDRGILRTVVALSSAPGAAVREYVEGRTRRHIHPFKYLLVSLTLATIVGMSLLTEPVQFPGMAEEEAILAQERALEIYGRFFNVILAGVIPFLTLSSSWLFRRARFNTAEHLVFNTYVLAQQNLIFFITVPVVLLPGLGMAGYSIIYTVLISAYYVWACAGFFRLGLWSSIWRGTLAGTLAYVLYFGAALGGVLAYRLLTPGS